MARVLRSPSWWTKVRGGEFGSQEAGPPNKEMKLTRGGLVAGRSMVGASRHGIAATKGRGAVVRPAQPIASVGQTWGEARARTRGTHVKLADL